MRTFVALAILAVVAVCVNSEGCRVDDDCLNGLTMCSSGHSLTCHNRGCYCESKTSGDGCTTKDDCSNSGECHGHSAQWHCVDTRCRCFHH